MTNETQPLVDRNNKRKYSVWRYILSPNLMSISGSLSIDRGTSKRLKK